MMRLVTGLFIAAFLMALSVVATPGDALANGMPYTQFPGSVAGVLTPLSDRRVEVVREELTIDFTPRKEAMVFNPHLGARVEARYTMNNRTSSGLEIPVAFPHPGPTVGWVVTLDGREIPMGEDRWCYGESKKHNTPTGKSDICSIHWLHHNLGRRVPESFKKNRRPDLYYAISLLAIECLFSCDYWNAYGPARAYKNIKKTGALATGLGHTSFGWIAYIFCGYTALGIFFHTYLENI